MAFDPALAKSPGLPDASDFSSPALGTIYALVRERIARGESVDPNLLGQELSADEMSLLVRIMQKPEILSRGDQALRDYIKKIQEQKDARQQGDDLLALQQKLKETKGYRG